MQQQQALIDEMNNKYIELQNETSQQEIPTIEESQLDKELKILNYKK